MKGLQKSGYRTYEIKYILYILYLYELDIIRLYIKVKWACTLQYVEKVNLPNLRTMN